MTWHRCLHPGCGKTISSICIFPRGHEFALAASIIRCLCVILSPFGNFFTGPRLVQKLKSDGDPVSAALVDTIVRDEVGHVTVGLRWFRALSARNGAADPVVQFHGLVRKCVMCHHCPALTYGFDVLAPSESVVYALLLIACRYVPDLLPGPFNEAARTLANMGPEWYIPVSKPTGNRRSFSTLARQPDRRHRSRSNLRSVNNCA